MSRNSSYISSSDVYIEFILFILLQDKMWIWVLSLNKLSSGKQFLIWIYYIILFYWMWYWYSTINKFCQPRGPALNLHSHNAANFRVSSVMNPNFRVSSIIAVHFSYFWLFESWLHNAQKFKKLNFDAASPNQHIGGNVLW